MNLTKAYNRLQFYWLLIPVVSSVLLGASVAVGLVGGARFTDVSKGTVWLLILFLIPIIVQFIGGHVLGSKLRTAHELYHRSRYSSASNEDDRDEAEKDFTALIVFSRFYLGTMALCLLSYGFLWLMYVCGGRYNNWEGDKWYVKDGQIMTASRGYLWLSFAAMIAITVLLSCVIRMTHAIIAGAAATQDAYRNALKANRTEWHKHDYLKRGASQASFLSLLFFLTIFLGVSYLFAFALAFHDKTQPHTEPALVMRNQVTPAASPLPSPQTPAASATPAPLATFHFDSGTAVLNVEGSEEELKKASDKIRKDTKDNNPVRVTITGSADLRQIESRAYQSNYELAEARAHHIKQKLMKGLSVAAPNEDNEPRNIEWVCLSEPKEGAKESVSRKAVAEESPEDRVVSVFVEPKFEEPNSVMARQVWATHPNALSLMDYVYFANYTITTTGYGDIIPNTAYTKFICSFANICEVFFLVVLFNSLLSLRGNKSEHEMPHNVEEMSPKVRDLHQVYIVNREQKGQAPRLQPSPTDGGGNNAPLDE